MKPHDRPSLAIDIDDLRLGMYVHLDLGWLRHPFARNRFKLETPAQIAQIRALGLTRVQVWPGMSDVTAFEPTTIAADLMPEPLPAVAAPLVPAQAAPTRQTPALPRHQRTALEQQRRSLERTELAHAQATRQWQAVMRETLSQPRQAHAAARALGHSMVEEMIGDRNVTLHLLTEAAGTAASQHAVNVTVLSLMLARHLELSSDQIEAVAVGALMHDIGKLALPESLRASEDSGGMLAQVERHEHVAQGVRMGMAMEMDAQALRIIAQHHELHDGSGLPRGLRGEEIALPARIVSLVNVYDRLCNPRPGQAARTPHEAQAWLYAQRRGHFDPRIMAVFIKVMGVYPPGSMVELTDGRFALVMAAHGEHALKPDVLVHDARVPRDEAVLLPLSAPGAPGIRRSVPAQHLPRATLDYLAPRERVICYFAQDLHGEVTHHVA